MLMLEAMPPGRRRQVAVGLLLLLAARIAWVLEARNRAFASEETFLATLCAQPFAPHVFLRFGTVATGP